MKKVTKVLALMLVFAMLFSLAACGGQKEEPKTEEPQGGEEAKVSEATITMAYTAAWDSLMPYYSASGSMITRSVWSLIYDRFVLVTEGGTKLEPRAAKSWESADGGKAIVFHLNEDSKWHDGKAVTAEDWVFTFGLVTDPKAQGVSIAADPMPLIAGTDEAGYMTTGEKLGVEALDAKTLKITFKAVTDPDEFLATYNRDIAVLPKHLLEGKDVATILDDAFWTAPVGSGPLKFDSQPQIGQEMFLKANRDYQFPVNGYGTMKLTVVASANTVQAEANGDVDVVAMGSSVSKSNSQVYEGLGGKTVKNEAGTGFTEVIFNNQSVKKEVRQAIAYAIDREKACQVSTEGLGYVVDSYVLPFSEYCNKNLKRERNIEKAKELCAAAGYKGEAIHLAVGPSRTDLAAQIKQDCAEAGINIEIVNVEAATMFNGLIERKYDMGISGHTGSVNPLWFAYTVKASQYGRTYYSVSDTQFEDTINAIDAAGADKAQRKALINKLQEQIFEEVPWIPLWFSNTLSMVSPTVEGIDYRCGSFCNENVWAWSKAE